MSNRRFAVAAFSVALAATCQGAIHWHDEYNGALDVAKKSGRPLVVVFAREGDRVAKRLFEREQLIPFQRQFVFVFLEVSMQGNTFTHGLFSKYPPGPGAHNFPLIFFAGTDEKILGNTEGAQKTQDLASSMMAALKKHGPVPDEKKARSIQEALDRANAHLAKKEYGPAAKLYQEIVESKLKVPAAETAKKELAKIGETVKKQLEAAKVDLADKAYPEAIQKLLDIEEEFPTLDAGKQASQELAKLRELPEAKPAFEKVQKKETVAERRPAAPKMTNNPEDVDNDFFAEEELDALDKMANGPPQSTARPQRSASAECARLLSLARSWIANKQPDKARELLLRITEKHPDSIQAEQAKVLLKSLEPGSSK